MSLRTAPKPLFIDFEGVIGQWVDDDTPPAEYSDFLELESIEITAPEQESIKLVGARTSTLGQAIDSQNRATDSVASAKILANTFHPALQALAMGGSVAEATQSTGAITGEAVTTVLDVWVPLANSGIDPSGIALDIAGAVDSAKYEIDHELGMIRALHADAVGTGTIGYSLAARTWEQYQGGVVTNNYYHVMGKATNAISKKVGTVDIWRANLAPDSAFKLPSGDAHFQGSFAGDLITPTIAVRGFTPTSPWRFRDRVA
jgi:hypothetical protein